MGNTVKSRQEILAKLGIESLNEMQLEMHAAVQENKQVVLLSPTGSGKTLAFLLPLFESLSTEVREIQALILVPSRELAQQIDSVARSMGTGYKCAAIYGGRSGNKDKIDLKHRPAVLIGTPGRVADHIRRETFPTDKILTVILDEFDKSLEVGYEVEMKEIMAAVSKVKMKVLTSATQGVEIPAFMRLKAPFVLDRLEQDKPELEVEIVMAGRKDKLKDLVQTLNHLGDQTGIIFCNFKDSIQFVSEHLEKEGISHGFFHGGMEQLDREHTLVKFRNGTIRLLLATDLAARGLDIPELGYIIHYQLPSKEHEFTHRNGRTARMKREGTAIVLLYENDERPIYLIGKKPLVLTEKKKLPPTTWATVYVTGGRRDKISKGDLAGLFFKEGGLTKHELGMIELKQDAAFVAVQRHRAEGVVSALNNAKLKTKKVRMSILN